MIDFQYIRRKQKWLFGVIAIVVIFSFVVLFTPDAEEIVFGSGRQAERGLYGQLDGETVNRKQWIEARTIVQGQMGQYASRFGDDFINTRAVQVLGEMALMKQYNIQPSQADSDAWISEQVDGSIDAMPLESRPTRREAVSNWAQGFGGESRLEAFAKHQVGTRQLQSLAGVSGVLISSKEAEIKFRDRNEQYEAEAIFLNHTNYLALVQVTDEQIKKQYTNSLAKHRIPERRQIAYVTFPATNYLDLAEEKFNELKPTQREPLLQSYWAGITNLVGYKTNSILALAGQIANVRTNEYKGMKPEEAASSIRSEILTTAQGIKSGLAVIEAYKAGLDFQQSLEETHKTQPALDTLEKMALLQSLTANAPPPVGRQDSIVSGLPQVRPSQVFALTKENPFIIGDPPLGGAAGDYYIASLKKILPSRNRSFVEAKASVTADFKKAESIKMMKADGEKIQQSIKLEKTLVEVAKENNLSVTKLGPFDSAGGAIPGLANKANSEDVRTQALGLSVNATSELIASSTDSSDPTSEESAFVVKLTAKTAVSKDKFEAEFPAYLENERANSESRAYSTWIQAETADLYKFSLKTYLEGDGEIKVESDDGDSGFYKQGTRVTLIAKPAPNFTFKEWSGAVTVNTGSATNEVVVSSNSSVTASFVPKDGS
jgi:hypothetical protein